MAGGLNGLNNNDSAYCPIGGSWANGVKDTFSYKIYNGKTINFILNDFV